MSAKEEEQNGRQQQSCSKRHRFSALRGVSIEYDVGMVA
jgi:hypothetical protein